MENGSKVAAYAVVALIVGVIVGVAAGYVAFDGSDDDTADSTIEYGFYLYFGEGDERNGWYTADATNATEGFEKAMEAAGFEYEVSSYGYIASIDDETGSAGWYIVQYVYSETTSTAAEASILYPYAPYGTLSYSNGWKSISGYDETGVGLKLEQFSSQYYFMSMYDDSWAAASPADVTDWMTTGPFAA